MPRLIEVFRRSGTPGTTRLSQTEYRTFAELFTGKVGLHNLTGQTAVGKALLARNIANIMVGNQATAQAIIGQTKRVLGVSGWSVPKAPNTSVLFNVPDILTGQVVLDLTNVKLWSAAGGKEVVLVTLEHAANGWIRLGPEIADFMRLNGLDVLEIDLAIIEPAHKTRVGYMGTLDEGRLGKTPSVRDWALGEVIIDPAKCGPVPCLACRRACPHEAIQLVRGGGGKVKVIINPDDCKSGCQLCFTACTKEALRNIK